MPEELSRVARSRFTGLSHSELTDLYRSGAATVAEVVEATIQDIVHFDHRTGGVHSVLAINGASEQYAERLGDRDQTASKNDAGPLYGVPVLVKDNTDTADQPTTGGSLLLARAPAPSSDAFVVERLRASGAVIVGKANLSEWSNMRSSRSISGWSGVGGQTRNPHDLTRSPGGSSGGSAAAVACGLVPMALGTETNGSVMCPAAVNGVVGIKPTVGITSRRGVIPISSSQDSVGVFGRSVRDARTLLSAVAGLDLGDPASVACADHFGTFLEHPTREPGSYRVGIARHGFFDYAPEAVPSVEAAILALAESGVVIVDHCDEETPDLLRYDREAELDLLLFELNATLSAYLSARDGTPFQSLADLIEGNRESAERELSYFDQDLFERAAAIGTLDSPRYVEISTSLKSKAQLAIDETLQRASLDAIFVPTMGAAWQIDPVGGDKVTGSGYSLSAVAGYPVITVPVGFADGLPVGGLFFASAYSEGTLCALGEILETALGLDMTPAYRNAQ
jgi:amidase